jgi:hypothetical protein
MGSSAFSARPSLVLALVALVALSGCAGVVPGLGSSPEWGFSDATESAGLNYEARASGVGNGDSGIYATDFNNDGWPDVLAIGGEEPVLFENDEGTFERSGALPDLDMHVQGALFFDADSDGSEDLLLLPRGGEAVFLRNDGGEFVREENGLGVETGVAVGASTADYDGDGDQDVFVIQYGDWASGTPEGFLHPEGGYVTEDNGAPNLLFENTEEGFERVEGAGISGSHWTLATSFADLTGDGYPDIHVANDFNNDTLYVNQGDGTFERRVMGAATSRNGMSSEVGDFNGDARPDVFVTNIYFPISESNISEEKRQRLERYFAFVLRSKRIEGNNLMINQGGGEVSFEGTSYGVKEGGWGWASAHVDLNNDGERDLFHATQEVIRIDEENPVFTYPMLFEREGDSFERRDASEMGFAEVDGRGVAQLDFDRDGDQDLLVSTYNGAFKLYENNADELDGRHSLQLHVVEDNGETTAIGATVELTANGTTESAVLNAKADYQSQDTRVLHFGLGETETVSQVTVTWPDGTEHTFEDVEADQRLLVFPNGTVQPAPGS